MVDLHPLLENALLTEVCAAKLVKLLVVQIGLAGDPDRSDFNCDQIVVLAGQQEEIAPIGNGKADARVMVKYSIIDAFKPADCRFYDAGGQFRDVDVLEGKKCDRPQGAAGSQSDHHRALELSREED